MCTTESIEAHDPSQEVDSVEMTSVNTPCNMTLNMAICLPQEDLSMPMVEEEIDGLSGLLFPFYDPDTHMLYLAGKVNKFSNST